MGKVSPITVPSTLWENHGPLALGCFGIFKGLWTALRVHVSEQIYFGLKVVPIWVLWGPSIYYLGTWTLRAGLVYMKLHGCLGFIAALRRGRKRSPGLRKRPEEWRSIKLLTHRPLNFFFWGLAYRILNIDRKKELLWGLWVPLLLSGLFRFRVLLS